MKKPLLPDIFRPLLWSFRWDTLDPEEDKEDIILNTINEGSLEHWRWIIQHYGKAVIRATLEARLASEIHAESRHLARLIFGVSSFRNAR